MPIASINPANGESLATYKEMSKKEVSDILASVQKSWQEWSRTSLSHRSSLIQKAAQHLREHMNRYSSIITKEMGKPIADARSEVEKCAWICEYYASSAEAFLKPEIVKTDRSKSYVAFQPMGVVLAIMPWNYPFWQVFRFAAPALMAGNGAVLKHASNVPRAALFIEELFQEVGFPKNIFRTLLVENKGVESIIESDAIQAVTLTGSTAAGKIIAAKAGSVLKKVVLELGGSDPYIILADANLEEAVAACVSSRLKNSGQSCIAAKRFIVDTSIVEPFTERFITLATQYQIGDPMDASTQLGPLARFDLRDNLHRQVQESINLGANCLMGGSIPTETLLAQGAFYPPTVLANVKPGMPAYHEELFGPVAAIIPVKDEKEAIKVANDTPFGLAGAIFSQDVEKAEKIAREEIESGTCFVNHQAYSDARLPFGGIKASGYGRELSHFGIREFVNIKTIAVR